MTATEERDLLVGLMLQHRLVGAGHAPGAVLAEILADHGLGVADGAVRLGVPRQTLQRLLAGQTRVSAAMALRLGRPCGNGREIWLNLQTQYDLAKARAGSGAEIEAVKPLV